MTGTRVIRSEDNIHIQKVFGNLDRNVGMLEKRFGVSIYIKDGILNVKGDEDDVEKALRVIDELLLLSRTEMRLRNRK